MTMGQRHPYTAEQKAAVCDAMQELLESAGNETPTAEWLKTGALKTLYRTMRVEIFWSEEQHKFLCL
jgi:hypothetical protein